MLVSFQIPSPPSNFGANYIRFIPRNEMDIAVVGCGVSLELSADQQKVVNARVALGAVAPRPLLVKDAATELIGKNLNEDSINKAAAAAQEACRPINDMRGTVEYRRHLAGVLTRRALRKAIERAKGV
jgi:carbon-monoxide dehydrogenase medium subunit